MNRLAAVSPHFKPQVHTHTYTFLSVLPHAHGLYCLPPVMPFLAASILRDPSKPLTPGEEEALRHGARDVDARGLGRAGVPHRSRLSTDGMKGKRASAGFSLQQT